jgi:GxxExxY protein
MGRVQTPHDALTYKIIGLAMAVHKELGPGFPEEIYQRAMAIAMTDDGVPYERELSVDLTFRDRPLGRFEIDFVADRKVILELKALSALAPVHEQQIIAYLAVSGLDLGLLINFGAASLQYKRVFPPNAVQTSAAFQRRRSFLSK